jgi:hypothetical protein
LALWYTTPSKTISSSIARMRRLSAAPLNCICDQADQVLPPSLERIYHVPLKTVG